MIRKNHLSKLKTKQNLNEVRLELAEENFSKLNIKAIEISRLKHIKESRRKKNPLIHRMQWNYLTYMKLQFKRRRWKTIGIKQYVIRYKPRIVQNWWTISVHRFKKTLSRRMECEVKWALGIITMNKASGRDEIPVELFQILMMLWKCCTQYVSKFGK